MPENRLSVKFLTQAKKHEPHCTALWNRISLEHRHLILPLGYFDQTVLMKCSVMLGRELSILKSVTKEYFLVEATMGPGFATG